jgi:hypothetical protein
MLLMVKSLVGTHITWTPIPKACSDCALWRNPFHRFGLWGRKVGLRQDQSLDQPKELLRP